MMAQLARMISGLELEGGKYNVLLVGQMTVTYR